VNSDESAGPSINWDVSDGNIEIVDAAEVGIGEFSENLSNKNASKSDKETILSSNDTRRTLLTELLELEVYSLTAILQEFRFPLGLSSFLSFRSFFPNGWWK
jgi:hypothetical protein